AVSASRWQTRRMAPSGSPNPVNIYPQHSTERGKARQYAAPASLLEMREHRGETRVALFKHDRVDGVLTKKPPDRELPESMSRESSEPVPRIWLPVIRSENEGCRRW